jgi:hypothetical protein
MHTTAKEVQCIAHSAHCTAHSTPCIAVILAPHLGDGHGHDAVAHVVNVLANQVDAACAARHGKGASAGSWTARKRCAASQVEASLADTVDGLERQDRLRNSGLGC